MHRKGEGGGGTPKADAVRKISKEGYVKMQTRGAGVNKSEKNCRHLMFKALGGRRMRRGGEKSQENKGEKQCCQITKFDPFLSLDCARVEVEGVGAQSEERKVSNFAA